MGKPIKSYRFGFEVWGLVLFLVIMLPNFIWFIVPAPDDIQDADETIQKAQFAEELIDYFRNTNSGEREKAYFEKMLDLKYENECLKRENEVLKAENWTLKEKLNKAYDFMRQFTINGMNMLEHFLRSIGEWVQQKVAGMSR